MDKNAIKKYAVWARRELISRVSQKALQYGISEKETVPASAASVNGVVLSAEEIKQRKALIEQINAKGYEQVMEEVAYTWFNRFIALRFMEVNGYLPSHVRVFTDEDNSFKPQIITEAINLELDGLDMDKVYAWKDANDNDSLFKYLIITQCNALSPILPRMFQRIADYTELLFPDNLLREGSVIQQMIELIPEDDWKDAVQIIGWLYQYYNSEKKDEVFAALKKNVKITKENIPAATQLFTPDWIVRYMVENSLGRLWIEGHPNDSLKAQWKYYLEEAEQEPDVQAQLATIRKEYAAMAPEQIKCIDPCAGSGHILAYMFDVLVQIYEDYGYSAREAVRGIVENNLYGLDIDERAAQLAYFAVMMKARQYDRRFFARKDECGNPDVPQPHVYAICESNGIDSYALDYFMNGDQKLKSALDSIIKEMHNAKEYGSILNITPVDFPALYARFDEVNDDIHISRETVLNCILPLVQVAEVMARKYDICATNPPYMGLRNMSATLVDFCKENYPTTSTDLFSCFIEKGFNYVRSNGFNCMVTMQSWMFLSSFEQFRTFVLNSKTISTLMHMDNMVMGIAFGTAVTVFRNCLIKAYKGTYDFVTMKDLKNEAPCHFPCKNRFSQISSDWYKHIDGFPIAYWASEQTFANFANNKKLGEIAAPRQGVKTLNNDYFMKLWFEVEHSKIGFGMHNFDEAIASKRKWFPYTKGGDFRKWYGNNDYVVNWENDGAEMKAYAISQYNSVTRTITNLSYWFKRGLTWSMISSGSFSLRYVDGGFGFDARGSMMFMDEEIQHYVLGFLCSKVVNAYMDIVSPTISFEVGNISKLPVVIDAEHKPEVDKLVSSAIAASKEDWDSFEISWDFQVHPLVSLRLSGAYAWGDITPTAKLESAYKAWELLCEGRFNKLKENEEELNRIFIDIYGLQDELTPEVEDKDVTVRLADKKRDIKSLISYAVGCMFGRYSIDKPGLMYAGGGFDDVYWQYKGQAALDKEGNPIHGGYAGISLAPYHYAALRDSDSWETATKLCFEPDKDNIIPICDDEYFADDIVGRFIRFIEVVYGKDTLQENLRFIADALGGSGQPKDVIRNYFLNDFYADHLKVYQKRPIYWLFDSGKNNGFKALVYMHRYQPDTIARMRTDYVHEQQARYRTAIADLEQRIVSASTAERVKLSKRLKQLQEQATEIQSYEEKIHHLADQYIAIDLDDGVKKNYAIFGDVLAKIK